MKYSEKNEFDEKTNFLADMKREFIHQNIDFISSKTIALDIGGAGGVLGGLLSFEVLKIYVCDIIDHQVKYSGEFPKLLVEKFGRNNLNLDLSKIEFHTADAMNLPYRDNLFDLVVSNNVFEHIPEPNIALKEALRVTKPGGIIYIKFDPVWTADTGGHFHHFVNEPWAHLIHSPEKYRSMMAESGADTATVNEFPSAMNKKPVTYYRNNFPEILKNYGVKEFYYDSWSGCFDDSYLQHKNLNEAAKIMGLQPIDLLVRGFYFCIRK